MADSLRASKQGLEIVDRARRKKGWNTDAPAWLNAADNISRSTLQRFRQRQPIRQENFIAICKAVGIENWEEIVDDSPIQQVVSAVSCSACDEGSWVGREELSDQLSERIQGSCRVLILTGITGIGKTALAERLALKLQEYWHEWIKVNFEDGTPRDFTGFADAVLIRLKEEVTPDDRKNPEVLLSRLVQNLRDNRYLLQIDSLEMLLEGKTDYAAKNEFQYEGWWEFFNRLLACQYCKSRLILTSQDLPTQFYSCKSKYWDEKPLNGLSKPEQLKLFEKLFQREGKAIEAEAEGHLERIGQAYEGHPLVIEVIAGEILAHPFNGNVALYWQRYSQEFEMIALATNSQMLELRVKDRVRQALMRLSQDVPAAYTLLCYSSVYRRPVPESFWLAMLQEPTLKEKVTALETLKYRRLFEEIVAPTNQFLIRQHHLIQCVAYDLLQETDKEAAHYIAANMWIMAYEPDPDVSNLEQVRGYLEAFYHFCEVKNWEVSSEILSMSLDTPTNEQLHKQLGTWGYYHEQIELYNRLLGKINLNVDCCCLNNLGTAYHSLSNCLEAIEYFERSLNIARQIGDCKQEENALGNLGNVYHSIGKYREAIKYHQQSLTISCKIGDRRGEGIDQCHLGLAYSLLGKPDQAIEYLQKSLLIAREIGNRSGEAHALGNLALVYRSLGNYDQAIEYDRQSLTIESEIGDRYGEADQLRGLGLDYLFLGDYEQAIDYHQQSLIIAQEINAYGLEGTALCNLGVALIQLKEYSEALKYLPAALEILQKIGYRHGETITLYNLASIYYQLGELDLAHKFCDRALSIATELGLPQVNECQELKEQLLSEQT